MITANDIRLLEWNIRYLGGFLYLEIPATCRTVVLEESQLDKAAKLWLVAQFKAKSS